MSADDCGPHWDLTTASARVDELEAENDALREALKELLFLRQMHDDYVSGECRDYAKRSREAWQAASDLVGGEG
jgi:hypothetical protein